MSIKRKYSLSLILSILTISVSGQAYKDKTAPTNARIDALVKAMTLDEKLYYIGGEDPLFIRAIPRLGIPQIKMSDGPVAVGAWGQTTSYPAGILAAASWDANLIHKEGIALGEDAKSRGVHILLAPGVNIYRAPMCGRNFEYFGEDPYLTSRMAVNYIKGVQSQNVMAVVKHFAANNQEWDRHNVSSDVDDRTLNEIYFPAFKAAVQEAKVGSLMNSYNLVNGVHASQSKYLLDTVLRQNWGFKGFVMSDWVSTYDGVAAANAGLDLEMPTGANMNKQNLLPAIKAGKVSEAIINQKIRNILTTLFRFGFYDHPQQDTTGKKDDPANAAISLQMARGGMVLLKNQDNLLPLSPSKIKTILVVGPNANEYIAGGGSSYAYPFHTKSILQGIQDIAGVNIKVNYVPTLPGVTDFIRQSEFYVAPGSSEKGLKAEYFNNPYIGAAPKATRNESFIDHTWLAAPDVKEIPADGFSIRFTGVVRPKKTGLYQFFVNGDDGYRLWVDDKQVMDEWHDQNVKLTQKTLQLEAGKEYKIRLEYYDSIRDAIIQFGYGTAVPDFDEAVAAAKTADAIVVAAGFNNSWNPGKEGEYRDRSFELPKYQDSLINAMAAANPNTIVTINAGGNVYMQPWLKNVKAVLHCWYPGQEGGTAAAEILFGKINPSGKLPATFEKEWKDNPTYNSYYDPDGDKHVKYTEGLFVGYRGYEKNKVQPQFPFGYGLSFTTFAYNNLQVQNLSKGITPKVVVTFELKNTGNVDGAEVAQLYVHQQKCDVERPYKELKGFSKVFLKKGETKKISITLDDNAFAYYTTGIGFAHDPGTFDIMIGSSSQDIKLNGKVALK
jgi:beta-glucosidase